MANNKHTSLINILIYGGVPLIWLILLFGLFDSPLSLIKEYWHIAAVSFFAAGFANITAVGGGFIFIPLVIIVLQLSPLTALKLSLATEAFGMTSGAYAWLGTKGLLTNVVSRGIIFSTIGMTVGTFLITPNALDIKLVFAIVSIVIGIETIRFARYHGCNESITDLSKAYNVMFILGGLLTAWISIGIGELTAFALMKYQKIETKIAIGTGVAILAYNAFLGFIFHLYLGGIPYHLLIFTAPAVILGSRTFVLYAHKVNRLVLIWIFSIIALLDGVVMLYNIVGR